MIKKRIGRGLHNDPKWRLSTWSKSGSIPDYNALQLREIINISDRDYKGATAILRGMNFSKPAFVDRRQDKHFLDKAEAWSTFRFKEFDLRKKKAAVTRTQLKEVEFDEKMIHLSTGVYETPKAEIHKSERTRSSTTKKFKNETIINELPLAKDSPRNSKISDYIELQPFTRARGKMEGYHSLKRGSTYKAEKRTTNEVHTCNSDRPKRKCARINCKEEIYTNDVNTSTSGRPKRKCARINYLNEDFF